MTPHWFGMVWLSFLFAFTALCLLALCRAVVDGPPWRLDRLPGGVAVIGTMWLASAGKFAFEARWSLDLLREIVNTEHEVPADSALQEKVGE